MMMPQLSNFFTLLLESWSSFWDGLSFTTTTTTRVILTSILACFTWYAWLRIKKSRRNTPPLPPGPLSFPILGHLPFIGKDMHCYLARQSEKYGPVVKFLMGRQVSIVISSASAAREVFRDKDLIFAQHDYTVAGSIISYSGHDLAFCQDYPEWKMLRKIYVQELVSHKSLEACQQFRRQEILLMLKDVYGKVGSPVNMYHLISLTMLNVMIRQVWGLEHGEERIWVAAEVKRQIEIVTDILNTQNISDHFPFLAPFDLQGIAAESKKAMRGLDRVFDYILESRRKDKTKGYNINGNKDFLQAVLDMKQEGDDDKPLLSMAQVKGFYMDIYTGIDTTGTMIGRVMGAFLTYPEIMRKACQELDQVVGQDKMVEESHLPKLHYLNGVLKETFRLYPVDPLLVPHTTNEDCIVSGYTIPKRSSIYFNVWAIQRDPKAWDNPLEFRPERFVENPWKGDFHGNNFNFFPFGSGRRICGGIPLTERMLLYMLASLVHSFEWKLPEGEKIDLTTRKLIAPIPTAKPSILNHINGVS